MDFRIHIVDFGLLKQESKALQCAAKAGEDAYKFSSVAKDTEGKI